MQILEKGAWVSDAWKDCPLVIQINTPADSQATFFLSKFDLYNTKGHVIDDLMWRNSQSPQNKLKPPFSLLALTHQFLSNYPCTT
jgi:hypothetical protein